MKMYRGLFLVLVFMCIQFTKVDAQKKLLALSKGEHILAIIDPVSLKEISRIPVGSDPHEIVSSDDGKTAYVSISYAGNFREIDVIDLVNKKRLSDIDILPFMNPHGLFFASGKLYFSAEGSKAVGRYDPVSKDVDWAMGTGEDRTHMVYVSRDSKKIFTTNVNSGTVSILHDTTIMLMPSPPQQNNSNPPPAFTPRVQKLWMHTVVPVAKGAEGFDVSPEGKELWTAASEDGTVFIIDTEKKKVIGQTEVKTVGANRLKFTPDGKWVVISCLRTGELYILNASTRALVKKLKLGNGCAGILADTDSKRVFVACSADNYIAVIDLETMSVTQKINLSVPDGLAWADEGGR